MVSYIFSLSFCFKRPEFHQESEARLVVYIQEKSVSEKMCFFRKIGNQRIPYIKVFFPQKLPLISIGIGPKNNMDIAEKEIKVFLDSNHYSNLDIQKSNIRLRY
jgi:hypothetical protein